MYQLSRWSFKFGSAVIMENRKSIEVTLSEDIGSIRLLETVARNAQRRDILEQLRHGEEFVLKKDLHLGVAHVNFENPVVL